METLDEFDNEYPLAISFCERISPQDFERQASTYTQKSLQELYAQMGQNPRICERAVRKRKQMENEEAGLVRYLKAKFFSMLQGDVNYSNLLEDVEMGEKVEELKREMQKVSSYAHAAKSFLRRPPEMGTLKTASSGGFSPSQTKLPDPEVPATPQIFSSFPKQMERPRSPSTDLKQLWAGMSSGNHKSMVDLHPLMLNPGGFRSSFLGSSSVSRLKYSHFARTPPPTPSASPSSTTSVFNTPVLSKFQGSQEDEKDHETSGPGSHPATGP